MTDSDVDDPGSLRDRFEAAMIDYARSMDRLDPDEILTGYYLIGTSTRDGESTAYWRLQPEGQPEHARLGLLDLARELEHAALIDYDDCDDG